MIIHKIMLSDTQVIETIELEEGEIVVSRKEVELIWLAMKDHWIKRDKNYETIRKVLHKFEPTDT